MPSPGDLPKPGTEREPRSPTLQAVSLPAEPQGKPKNTGVGSLSLLQGIFLTQELKRGLLHCRRILYHLSHQGSPNDKAHSGGSDIKESTCSAGDLGLIPGSGRSPEQGNRNPLQYSCLGNPVGREAWWATVHRSQT